MSNEIPDDLSVSECYRLLIRALDNISKDITTKISEHKEEVSKKFKEADEKIESLQNENKILKKQIESNERELKKNNVIIFGLQEEEEENLYEKVVDFIQNKIQIADFNKSDLSCVYRFGRQDTYPRPVLVKILALYRKSEILKNGYLLKNSNYSVSNDLSPIERQNQKILRKHLKKAKEQNLEAYIRGNNLIVDTKSYNSSDLVELEKNEKEKEEVKEAGKSGKDNKPTSKTKDDSILKGKEVEIRKRNNSERSNGSSRIESHTKINSNYTTRSQVPRK
ncbi:unnamed protein product [Phaedon cochleariae]|uniref:Endonuclease-reverse transcriptase n=1 Tax=Phaedon cochleariae TaxID=80249 RepID=A0A9N9SKI0_PHACE|nr:unnamed protein product [Phaedon cochleariae]